MMLDEVWLRDLLTNAKKRGNNRVLLLRESTDPCGQARPARKLANRPALGLPLRGFDLLNKPVTSIPDNCVAVEVSVDDLEDYVNEYAESLPR